MVHVCALQNSFVEYLEFHMPKLNYCSIFLHLHLGLKVVFGYTGLYKDLFIYKAEGSQPHSFVYAISQL